MNSSQTETTGQSHTVEPRLLPSRRTTGKIGGRPEALGDCWSGAVAVGSGSGDRWPHRRSMESLPVDAVYDASSALPCCYKSPDTVDPVRRADDELNADRIAHGCTRCRGLGVGGRCVRILGQVERQRRLPAQRGAVHAFAGVSHFPDASPGGPRVIPNWIKPHAPAFLSAQKACAKFLGGGGSPRAATASEKVALLNLERCIRAHGLANFSDPTTSPPPAPPPGSHTGNAVGIDGVCLVFPPKSPELRRQREAIRKGR